MNASKNTSNSSSDGDFDNDFPLKKQQPNNGGQDLYQLVQMQQNTINRLTQEVDKDESIESLYYYKLGVFKYDFFLLKITKKLTNVPRELYEKAVNDLEVKIYLYI